MAAVRGTSSDVPVSLIPRFTNLRTVATHSLGIECAATSKIKEVKMRSINPYEIRLTTQRDFESQFPRTSIDGGGK